MNGNVSIAAGFFLGLSTGPVCLTTCFPVLFPFALSETSGPTKRARWLFLGRLLAGRFIAYMATGILASIASRHLRGATTRLGLYAWLCLSLLMIAYGAGARFGHAGLCSKAGQLRRGVMFPFFLGILTGLSVCPPFLLALSYLMEHAESITSGVLFFIAFFFATTIYILPIGFLGHIPRTRWLETVGRVSALVAGAFFFCQASLLLFRIH